MPLTPGRPVLRLRASALIGALALAAAGPALALDLVLGGMTFVGSRAGEPDMVLLAERARIAHEGNIAYLESVSLDAAGENGSSSLLMTCDRAELDLTTSDFTAEGNVRGQTADGHRFRTEAARFEHEAGVIESEAAVDIVDPLGTRLEGTGFRYEIRTQRMRMRNAVVSEIAKESSE